MDLTVQIVVRNNKTTILKTLESVSPIASEILIADVGGDDGSATMCKGCKLFKFDVNAGYNHIRQSLTDRSQTDWQMYLHPWEVLAQGHQCVTASPKAAQTVSILQGTHISKEVRIWKKSQGLKFHNPVYEYIECDDAELSPIYLFSAGRNDYRLNLELIRKWKHTNSLSPEPFYYQALTLLALNDYDGFINASEHFMFLNQKVNISTLMNRYYYAMVQIWHYHKVRPAFQNLSICLENKPLMAEFWCLLGDAYYTLYNKYPIAKELYENAIVLGGRRMSNDVWPMDVSKYEEYPQTMISSCEKLIGNESIFIDHNN